MHLFLFNPLAGFTGVPYDAAGRLKSTTNRRGQRVDRTYDAGGALTSRTYGGSTVDTYATSTFQVSASNSYASYTTSIAPNTKFTSTVTSLGGESITLRHGWGTSKYSVFSADTSVATYRGTTNVFYFMTQYDTASGRPKWTQSSFNSARRINYLSYDDEGRVDTLKYDIGYEHRFAYTSRGRLKYAWFNGNKYYQRDSLDRVRIGIPSQGWLGYDALGRLTTNSTGGSAPCTSFPPDSAFGTGQYQLCSNLTVTTWSYDAAGNRSGSGNVYKLGNRADTLNGYVFEHDADGNITRKHKSGFDLHYRWDELGRLVRVVNAITNDSLEFSYDAVDRLARRKKNATVERYFLWDGDNLSSEFKGNMDKLWSYHYNGIDNPTIAYGDAFGGSTATSYAIKDPGSNVNSWYRPYGGSSYSSLTYDAWGVPSALSDTAPSLRWKGLHHEGGSVIGGGGLYYMRARWYDPEIGRFLSEDPIGANGGLNLYAFGGNDPINMKDPTGTCAYGTLSDPDDFSGGGHNAREGFKLEYHGSAIKCTGNDWEDPWTWWTARLDPIEINAKRPPKKPYGGYDFLPFLTGGLPMFGPPNTGTWGPNNQFRWYGPTGRGITDIDRHADHGAGREHGHDIDENGKRSAGRPLTPGDYRLEIVEILRRLSGLRAVAPLIMVNPCVSNSKGLYPWCVAPMS